MIFSSLPFHGIPPEAAAVCSHTFFCCRLLTAYQATTPHIPISSIESHHFPSVVFTRVCHPRSRSANFFCSLSSSFVFRCLRRRHSSSFNRTLLSNQSSLPLAPFPGNRRPRRFKQHTLLRRSPIPDPSAHPTMRRRYSLRYAGGEQSTMPTLPSWLRPPYRTCFAGALLGRCFPSRDSGTICPSPAQSLVLCRSCLSHIAGAILCECPGTALENLTTARREAPE